MKFPYNEKVLEHFKHPHNVGTLENADGKATVGSPACGDMVSVFLKVDKNTNVITDMKFQSYGCASNIATGSIITELAKGKTIDNAKKITWQQASEELGGLPPIKTHCSVLAVDGLQEAIQNYEERNGLIKEKEATTVEIIKKRLKHVMNPLKGLDIIRTNLVKDIKLNDRKIEIYIDLPSNHQFAANIEEEIREKTEHLWDIDNVSIVFTD